MFQSALYMDITDDDMRVSFADLFLGMDGMAIGVRYDIENGKFLSYQYSGNRATLTFEEGNRTVLKGWSQYLGITEEEAELYYSCSWSGREENENVTVFLMAE